MAFGDFLKKAADKGMKFVDDAVEKGKQMVEESKAAAEQARINEQKKKERAGAVCPTCEHGECYHLGKQYRSVTDSHAMEGFFYFCDNTKECWKKEVHEDYTYTLLHSDAISILKKCAHAENIGGIYASMEETTEAERLQNEAAQEYIDKYLPSFQSYEYSKDIVIRYVLNADGLAGKGMVCLFEKLDFDINDVEDIEKKFMIINNYGIGRSCGRHIGFVSPEDNYLADYSLFNRSLIDFEFVITVFSSLDSFFAKNYYKDVDVIKREDLYDSEGNIKPVGCVEDGMNSILGVIKSWEKDQNGEDNLIEDVLIPLYDKMVKKELPTVSEILYDTMREVFGE